MPELYTYKARGLEGGDVVGEMTAESEEQVLAYLSEQRYIPISIKKSSAKKLGSLAGFFRGTDHESLIIFTGNLSTLYKAGIPLLRALSLISIGKPESRFNYAIKQLRFGLQAGKSLSQAMAEFDDLFPQTYRATIAAGEESGHLDEILDELSAMLEEEMALVRQVKSGVRYPIMVILAIVAAFIVIISYVIPKFVDFYSSFGAQLPLPTRIIMGISQLFTSYWWAALAVVILLAYGFRRLLADERGKFWFDTRVLRLPIFGDLVAKGNVASFCLMLRILFKSGIPLIKSLKLLSESIKNTAIAAEVNQMNSLLEQGREHDIRLTRFEFMPQMALEMISIGLESGALDNMLQVVGRHYAKQVGYASRQLTAVLEPILTIVLGIFVLILALSIMLPMWNLIKVFNG